MFIIVLQGKISIANISISSSNIMLFSLFCLEITKCTLNGEYFFLRNKLRIFQSSIINQRLYANNTHLTNVLNYSHSILTRWRKHFSQLLNVHRVNEGRQAELHTAEPLLPEPSNIHIQLAIENPKSHNSPGVDQIPLELIKAGGRTFCIEVYKLISSVWNKEELPEEWKDSIIVPIYKKGDKPDCSN